MTQDEMIEMAREAGLETQDGFSESVFYFAKLIAEREREVVANWIMDKGFATGHGDCIVDLLDQLEWQIAEKEREACAKLVEESSLPDTYSQECLPDIADEIRARGQA